MCNLLQSLKTSKFWQCLWSQSINHSILQVSDILANNYAFCVEVGAQACLGGKLLPFCIQPASSWQHQSWRSLPQPMEKLVCLLGITTGLTCGLFTQFITQLDLNSQKTTLCLQISSKPEDSQTFCLSWHVQSLKTKLG